MDLTTNGVVITDAIKFVQTNKEKLTMATKEEENGKETRNLIMMKMKAKISYRKSRKRKQENLGSKQQTKFFELVNRTSMVSAVQGNVCAAALPLG